MAVYDAPLPCPWLICPKRIASTMWPSSPAADVAPAVGVALLSGCCWYGRCDEWENDDEDEDDDNEDFEDSNANQLMEPDTVVVIRELVAAVCCVVNK